MRLLIRAILSLFVLLVVLLVGVIRWSQRDANECYYFFKPLDSHWYLFDLHQGQAMEIAGLDHPYSQIRPSFNSTEDPMIGLGFRVEDEGWSLTAKQSDLVKQGIHWSPDGRYLAYLTFAGTVILKNISGSTIAQQVIDQPITDEQAYHDLNIYRLAGFTSDHQFLVYFDNAQIHILTVPELTPAAFSPLPYSPYTMIQQSSDRQNLLIESSRGLELLRHGNLHPIFSDTSYDFPLGVSWSRDQQFVALERYDFHKNITELLLLDLHNPSSFILQQEVGFMLSAVWDQRYLSFWQKHDQTYQLIRYDPYDQTAEVAVSDVYLYDDFSPDGHYALFYRIVDDQPRVGVWDIQTHQEMPLDTPDLAFSELGWLYWTVNSPVPRYQIGQYQLENPVDLERKFPGYQQFGSAIFYTQTVDGKQTLYGLHTSTGQVHTLIDQATVIQPIDWMPSVGYRVFLWRSLNTLSLTTISLDDLSVTHQRLPILWPTTHRLDFEIWADPQQQSFLIYDFTYRRFILMSQGQSTILQTNSDYVQWSPDWRYIFLPSSDWFFDFAHHRFQRDLFRRNWLIPIGLDQGWTSCDPHDLPIK